MMPSVTLDNQQSLKKSRQLRYDQLVEDSTITRLTCRPIDKAFVSLEVKGRLVEGLQMEALLMTYKQTQGVGDRACAGSWSAW